MPYRSKVTLVYLLGFTLDLLNMFALNAAYPVLGQELHASVAQLSWVSNLYMLGLTLAIPLGSWLATRLGERSALLLSLALFGLGSALAGGSGSIESLLSWRLLQGLGGGLLIPVGQAMAYRLYAPEQRHHLTSLVMMVALLVPALSPALGGVVVDHGSWRWIFYAMLPLTLITGALVLAWLPTNQPLPAPQSILDLRLLGQPLLRTAMLIYLCVPGVFIGANLVAALYLQQRLGLSATVTGALMLPWAVGALGAIAFVRWRFNLTGPKCLLSAGMLIQCSALLCLASPWVATHHAWLTVIFALLGLGSSLCSSSAQSLAFLAITPQQMGQASAVWNLNRQLSFCLGVAVLGAVLNQLLPGAQAFEHTFILAALLTLLPLPMVLKLPGARALGLTTATT
ncbi:MFS transporter [Pseudomonas rubra]|uniref:MFS transporter n=1 Tax=Pseudomonas rubra TaxID=2942627 RepID=A0ABT5PAA4_9PSED|nr:MFS transporter [Pseudomonas rubra]MDD1015111.1 MFS transporter [Pseudomonas rubra]MDD1037690.1 MFS transporter [Pseudomonas rubra]MDD1157390.1 MFS transporter [Pseudomonas rubra]